MKIRPGLRMTRDQSLVLGAWPKRTDTASRPWRPGFTLIEMLVVISIIGVLAGLVLGVMPAVIINKAKKGTRADMEGLINAIEHYKERKGFYPPDNSKNPASNSLYYELVGTIKDASGKFTSQLGGAALDATKIQDAFNASGFINASADANEVKNFYPMLKPKQYETNSVGVLVLVAPYKGATTPNPWHYNSSQPRHNPDSYDLWAEIKVSSRIYTIGNWRE